MEDECTIVSEMISYFFENPNFNAPIPDASKISNDFGYIAQSLTDNYPPESSTDAQKSGVDLVVNTKNAYKDVVDSIINNLNNYKSWTNGNYTKYADTFQSLLTTYDAQIQANAALIEGRSECGSTDAMNFSYEYAACLLDDFIIDTYDEQESISSMYGIINTELTYDILNILWSCMEVFYPVGCYVAAEESLIYHNQDLMNSQIIDVGETIVSMVTNAMNATVAKIQSKIDDLSRYATSWECNGY